MEIPSAKSSGGRSNKELVETLLRSRLFQNYEKVFTKATGLPLALQPLEFWRLSHRGKKKENPFCAMLAENPKTLSVCLQAHDDMVRHTGDVPHTVTCPFGLTESAVPVRLGEKTIGYLRVGQILRRAPSAAETKKVAQRLAANDLPFTGKVKEAWEHNPLIPPETYDGIVRLLTFFATQLSELINQIVLEQQNAEPPLVAKARAYIDQHRHDELSLAAVAQAAGASVFHFCKVFHQATGLKFTDYVSRVRLEEARAQLLNPSRRISEVAYDVGFQSLTQFNRTFRRVFGLSPTEFRRQHSSGGGETRADRQPAAAGKKRSALSKVR